MSKTTHYELNTPIGSEVLSVMTGLNPNFTTIDGVMYDNETRSTQALNKANVNEQNIATALGRITTAEGDIDTLESGLETANTNVSGLTSRMSTAESNIVSANNRITENAGKIANIEEELANIEEDWIELGSTSLTSATTITFSDISSYRMLALGMVGSDGRILATTIIDKNLFTFGAVSYFETVNAHASGLVNNITNTSAVLRKTSEAGFTNTSIHLYSIK